MQQGSVKGASESSSPRCSGRHSPSLACSTPGRCSRTSSVSFTDLSLLRLKFGGEWVGLDNYGEFVTGPEAGRSDVQYVRMAHGGLGRRCACCSGSASPSSSTRPFSAAESSIRSPRLRSWCPGQRPRSWLSIIWRWLLDPQNGVVNRFSLDLGLVSDPIAFLVGSRTVWPSVVTIIVWNTVPLVTLSLLACLQAVPSDLYEAARSRRSEQGNRNSATSPSPSSSRRSSCWASPRSSGHSTTSSMCGSRQERVPARSPTCWRPKFTSAPSSIFGWATALPSGSAWLS